MKKILITSFILLLFLFVSGFLIVPQQGLSEATIENYDESWKQVENFVKEGLPKSALLIVDEVYRKAKSEGNRPQQIKAMIYRVSLQSRFKEEHLVNAILQFEQELPTAEAHEKQILYSLLAEMYQGYYQQNRWAVNNRSTIADFDDKDIRTWDAVKLNRKIKNYYLQSLKDESALKTIPLNDYSAILQQADSAGFNLWPSLYDLLANRALDYFSGEDVELTDMAGINSSGNKILPLQQFLLEKTDKNDSSNYAVALDLYRHLLGFHLEKGQTTALVDLELKRLAFVYNHAMEQAAETANYIDILEGFREQNKRHPAFVKITLQLARLRLDQSIKYAPLVSDDYRWEKNEAAQICEEALDAFPNEHGADACRNLLAEIRQKNYNFRTAAATLPGKPFLALLNFKNTKRLYFRIVKVDPEKDRQDREKEKERALMSGYLQQEAVKKWPLDLPDTRDHQQHSTEIRFPAFDKGYYIIFASNDSSFSESSNLSYQPVWVSRLSYITKPNEQEGSNDLFVLDRETGNRISGVKIKIYQKVYEGRFRTHRTKMLGELVTDENGYVNFESFGGENYGSYLLVFEKDSDLLYSSDYLNFYRGTGSGKPRLHTYFFTDRAIYRPGQTVYFKGILVETTRKEIQIKPKTAVEVQFLNASRKKVSSASFISNDFGSFHGSFVIPIGGLNGQMRIKTSSGSLSFQVEEYKRPSFRVAFDTLEGQYKLNEQITVKGRAEDFAGSMLSMASVKYRVTRQAAFPQPWFYYRDFDIPWPVFQTETEIAYGTAKTLADGTFEVSFEAVPDLRVPTRFSPIFHYRVYANITDITGEVQTAETGIQIGAASMNLTISAAETIDNKNPHPISLRATNLSGAPLSVSAIVTVYKLSPPERLLNKRLWKQADLNIIPEPEFKKDFPHAVYKNEDNKTTWEKTTVLSGNISVDGKTDLFENEIRHWKPGEYLVEALATDKQGDSVRALQFFTLYASNGKKMPGKKIYWSTLSTELAEPGETVSLMVGSAAKKTKLLYEIMNGKELVERKWIDLSKGQKVIEIPVKETYRGNFSIKLSMVRFNRFYADNFTVQVPFSNKKLTVSLQTHRDFLTPGKKEEWQLKITGPKGETAVAELLAGMYDASLDQFRTNAWKLNLYHPKAQAQSWRGTQFQALANRFLHKVQPPQFKQAYQQYPSINWFGYYFFYRGGRQMDFDMTGMAASKSESVAELNVSDEPQKAEIRVLPDKGIPPPPPQPGTKETPPPLRTNFNETAYFYPELRTDSSGNILLSFTTPDALTEWKLMMLATSKDLKTGTLVKKIKAQKELMVLPNVPRFVRQGDRLIFSAKVVNFTDKEMEVNTRIEFLDAVSLKTVSIFAEGQRKSTQLHIPAKQNAQVSWEIEIPDNLSMLAYRIKASSATFSDGEERMFPVLTNRMLVTESLPMPLNGKETKTFRFDKLLNSDKIAAVSTRKDFRFTVEFTSNPAWYAVQALPFMGEGNRENSAALFNRYFANSLSAFVAGSNPKIQHVFESWKQLTPNAFLSKLQKNKELKNAVINATPWLLEAEEETEQKRRIGILFDLNRLAGEQQTTMERLLETQLSSGAWPWFKGMQDDRYSTQRIVLGFAKLNDKGVIDIAADNQQQQMLRRAVRYLDEKVREDYEKLKRNNPDGMDKNHLGSTTIQYLYARSLLIEVFPVPSKTQEAFSYYINQAKKYWLKQDKLLQGMIALTMNHLSYRNEAEAIVRSLKERSLKDREMGMYWRQQNGWNWYQAPVETQALLIEVFAEIGKQPNEVEQMKIWLLKQKQTQKWKTSSATAEAVFALLMYGEDLLDNNELVKVKVGSKTIETENPDLGVEAGTGYFKTTWQGTAIEPEMGKIEVSNPNNSIAWGAAYWQYFENLDRITAHDSPLSLEKKLFVEELTDAGPVIKPLAEGQQLQTGDKVIVRLIIRTDRNMEFVHLKDMRATAFEPLKTTSGYNYKGGLGFYKNITDVSTDFFMRYLHKGTYVLEYPLHVTQAGTFSNGIATIQSMYAPEFGAHSSGIRIEVKK